MQGGKFDKALKVALARGVKHHVFKPSGREIWTVVGKDNEYWIDPDHEYCSCKDFYFKTLSGKEKCYHLQMINIAKEKKLVEEIVFNDEEYSSFIEALIKDIFQTATR